MIDVNGILNAIQQQPGRSTAMIGGGAAIAGLATGMLAGKSGRKFMGKAAKYGAVAALGGLAYHAISRRKGAAPAPSGDDYTTVAAGSGFLPAASEEDKLDARSKSLVRAMIAAAKADGSVSELERDRMQARLQEAGLDAESRAFLESELQRPLNMEDVVSGVDGVEHAAEIYAASLVAIDHEGAVEKAYLQLLAARLGLEAELVAEIHRSADAPEYA